MKSKLLPFNLQFFAEDTSVNTPEAAEPAGTDGVQTDGDVSTEDVAGAEEPGTAEPEQSPDVNAQYAAIRRKAEEDARLKAESEQKKVNAMFVELFGKMNNPKTGRPIQTAEEYIEAVKAQQRTQIEERMKQGGVDPSIIQQLIASDPTVREAHEIMERQKVAEQDARIAREIADIAKVNPAIKNVDDLAKDASFPEVYERWEKSGRQESLFDIYRLVNFDALTLQRSEAAKQAAINQAKGKQHLTKTNGVEQPATENVPIPDSVLQSWKEAYPNLSMQELTAKYNSVI